MPYKIKSIYRCEVFRIVYFQKQLNSTDSIMGEKGIIGKSVNEFVSSLGVSHPGKIQY